MKREPAAGAPAVRPSAEVYTLRVWRHGGHFRAVLRAVGDEELHLFNEPRRVGEFLAAAPAGIQTKFSTTPMNGEALVRR